MLTHNLFYSLNDQKQTEACASKWALKLIVVVSLQSKFSKGSGPCSTSPTSPTHAIIPERITTRNNMRLYSHQYSHTTVSSACNMICISSNLRETILHTPFLSCDLQNTNSVTHHGLVAVVGAWLWFFNDLFTCKTHVDWQIYKFWTTAVKDWTVNSSTLCTYIQTP